MKTRKVNHLKIIYKYILKMLSRSSTVLRIACAAKNQHNAHHNASQMAAKSGGVRISSIRRAETSNVYPRSDHQRAYLDMLRNDEPNVVIASGCAGSGKTMLAAYVGIEKLRQGQIERVIITRPAVSVDEQHGFLPGTLEKKMEPWTRPIMDVILKHFSHEHVDSMIKQRIIEIAPLAYMRGRTFENAWIICDEAQNCTPNQILMVLTRMGLGSKLVITGDPMQFDRGFESNGLSDLVERVTRYNNDLIQHITFTEEDVVRHPIIPVVLGMYQNY
jgi:phosphate starvation-inducible protein PhoH and related proteins